MDLAIVGVSVVDVDAGVTRPDQTILIREDRIVEIQATAASGTPHAIRSVPGQGLYAIPGLWDMHVHALWDQDVAESWLAEFSSNGITGIRDMGGDLTVLQQIRDAPDSSRRNWPRIFAGGLILDGPEPVDPSVSVAVSDAQEAVEAVEMLAARGVDFIKVYTLLPRDAYFATMATARAMSLPVAGHVPAEVSVTEAVAAGQASIEHLRDELDPLCHALDPEACDALILGFRDAGVHNTPTLAVLEAKGFAGYRSPGSPSVEMKLPAVVQEYWQTSAMSHVTRPDEYFKARRSLFTEQAGFVARLAEDGAPLLAGSDTGNPFIYPGSSLHRELELLVEAGLSPRDALFAATVGPARFLDIAGSAGALRAGYTADLVLLEGNPLEDISNVRRISGVVLRGRLLSSSEEDVPGASQRREDLP